MLILIALGLASAALGACVAVALGVLVRLARLESRLAAIERQPSSPLGEGRVGELPRSSPLAGRRVALAIQQDHSHPVFANLLRESLLREEALIDDAAPDLRIEGEIVSNGYADVYFRAELIVRTDERTILTLSDRPPHGDRPANLVAEVVRRLETELEKGERRAALRELHERA